MTTIVELPPEMLELAAACAEHEAARAKYLAAQVELREAMRLVDAATSRKAMAIDALERVSRAALPTLGADQS